MRVAFLGAVIAAATCGQGCALLVSVPPLEPLPKSRVVLTRVGHTPQRRATDCGPACLTTVMRSCGSTLTLPEVDAQLKEATGGGTLVPELIYGARKNGLRCTMYAGSINDLRRNVLVGKPLILRLHPMPRIVRFTGRRRAHYVVAVGYDDIAREAIVHTGKRAFAAMSYRRLQMEWSRANFLTLLIQ